RGAGIAPEVAHLGGGVLTADNGPSGAIQAHSHGRHVQAAIAPPRREDGIVVLAEKVLCVGNIHRRAPSLRHGGRWSGREAHVPSLGESVPAVMGSVPAAEGASKARDGAGRATPHAPGAEGTDRR